MNKIRNRNEAIRKFDSLSQDLLRTRRLGLIRPLTTEESAAIDQWEHQRNLLRNQFPEIAFGRDLPTPSTDEHKPRRRKKQRTQKSASKQGVKSNTKIKKMPQSGLDLRIRVRNIDNEIDKLHKLQKERGLNEEGLTRLVGLRSLREALQSNHPPGHKKSRKTGLISPRDKSKSNATGRVGIISVHRGGLRQTRRR